jgi:hypothetical protein
MSDIDIERDLRTARLCRTCKAMVGVTAEGALNRHGNVMTGECPGSGKVGREIVAG